MKTLKRQFGISRKLLALSVLAAFGSAHAEDEEIEQLTRPESSVSVGVGAASGDSRDRAIYGQYNGRRLEGSNLLLDIDVDVVKRDDTMGLWTNFKGSNLGLDNQELNFSQNKQGDWKYSVDYSELVRRDPRTINSVLVNALSTASTVASLATPGTGPNLNLDIRRKATSLSAEKWLTSNLMFEASVKNEDRKGARLSGTGVACMPPGFSSIPCSTITAAMLMLPEPINSTTQQFEAKLNYSGEKYLVSGGYYGSFFSNANGSLSPLLSGNLVNPDGTPLDTTVAPGSTVAAYLQQPVALPPDNQAHQLYVSGNYAFTPTTQATFKYAYTHATQNEDFGGAGLTGAPAGVSNLGGVLDSNLAQFGVTARPMAKLSMLANLRYEEKADKTPLALYDGAYTNNLNSSRKLNGKLEGSYQFPENVRATLGVDYARVNRELPVSTSSIMNTTLSPLAGLREETRELGYRAELRRSLSETINAAISYGQSAREGGGWLSIGTYNAAGAYPVTMVDRKRDKVRVSADWTATDNLSLQFMLEDGKDTYTAPIDKGLRDTGMKSYGIDAAWTLSENWKLTGYVNQGVQTLHVDHNVGYLAELENINTSVGVGVAGRPASRLEFGGDLSFMEDSNRYKQSMATGAAIVGGGLPDVTYRVTSLKLFGKYALLKNADLRVDLVRQVVQFDEWTWGYNGTPFAYSDNTTVSMQQNQNVTFLGASYIYKFR
ncbi:MAG TPA: MtrB/PioB family decaheme-associated outer membrane protein [Gallionellaceae bacterium]|nr:MtrB/PioB family decaheme-associated outer membrane protein [Gallionellaceae bacterium]